MANFLLSAPAGPLVSLHSFAPPNSRCWEIGSSCWSELQLKQCLRIAAAGSALGRPDLAGLGSCWLMIERVIAVNQEGRPGWERSWTGTPPRLGAACFRGRLAVEAEAVLGYWDQIPGWIRFWNFGREQRRHQAVHWCCIIFVDQGPGRQNSDSGSIHFGLSTPNWSDWFMNKSFLYLTAAPQNSSSNGFDLVFIS